MILLCCIRTQPKSTLYASQYTMNPFEPSGRARTGVELMISEGLKYNSEMVCMITLTMRIDKDIIYEDYDEHVQVLLEHPFYQVYESYWGISMTKGDDYFWNVTFSDSELMIARSEVYLREIAGTLKLVKQVIDSGKRILVLDCDFIELMVINAHSEISIFFAHEQHWCTPRGNTGPDESLI
ncbi:hypothetical protein FXO38_29011 [Capsicum annuum]|uniref:Uncharacterized protein n=1 Tax=Capsicum annuum TaxID=4072 RepID=A0A2G2ZQC9_CAPAN|nr:hypothetical protein FXO38_29011 [Capsicum annuum]PHT84157.1 hypothetical protein T459_12600 [Capsicum annuum]